MSSLQPILAQEQYRLIKEREEMIHELRRAQEGVTVCIPCYGQSETLARTLTSVAHQTVAASMVIVVDDGSPEPDSEKIMRTARGFGAIYVRVTNRGLAAARNTGLMLADTFAFLPLDADDWIDMRYIEHTLPLLQNVDVVLTGIQEHGPTRNGTYMPGFDRPWENVTADSILDGYNRFYYCSLMRTQLLREVGGYNPKMNEGLEDADLWVDLLNRDARFGAVDEPLFHYTTNPSGMLQTIHRNGGYERMVSEMKRHHGSPGRGYVARA